MSRAWRTATAWGFAQLQRTDHAVKALVKELVDFSHHTAQIFRLKVLLHDGRHMLNQDIALHLHDVRWRGAHKQHDKIITRLFLAGMVFFVKIAVVKAHLDGSTCGGQRRAGSQCPALTPLHPSRFMKRERAFTRKR